ncbi:ATP-binding protein [Actinoplanes flavus]|uniref:histidine kinase n=1 Tax=Actinoplanes flavus TaxID=2820290 RepID=A0ABS3V0M5_9ACTN|nr:ATP-binding protein [Actinoplanes flavus]MBO3744382.1 PAS domain S-box protein [Actinoplanes flavus]
MTEVKAEIEERFGFFPPFFAPALDRPAVLENLWQQTLRSYVGNRLPPLLLERAFAVLSRYCDVPYCVVCHSCALRPMGMSTQQILQLLDGPRGLPGADEAVAVLSAAPAGTPQWAQPGPVADAALRAVVSMFLRDSDRSRLAAALRRVLPAADVDELVLFLGYVTTCLEWVEAHPELSYEADLRAITHLGPMLAEDPALGDFFADYTHRRTVTLTGREAALTAQAEEAEQRFFLIFEHAPIGMVIVDLQGRFVRVNRALADMLGYEPTELQAMTFAEISHPDDVDTGSQAIQDLIAGRIEVFQQEKRYRCARGLWMWARVSAALLHTADGSPVHVITQIEDVTERHEHAEQLAAANAELRRSNQDLEEFAAIVAHDLNGPLTGILGHAALLAEELPGDTPASTRDLLTRITTVGGAMAVLINDLLAYARAGTETLQMQWVDVDALIGELLRDLKPHLDAAHAEVRVAPLGSVCAHPTQLRQVLANLITNAVKYTATDVTPIVEITAVEYDDDIIFTFADNGLGIPPDDTETIFHMFHRAHHDAAPGTGVGLAICQRIIERHGGTIWAEARPNGGSLFKIRLPRYPTGAAHRTECSPPPPAVRGISRPPNPLV